MSLYKEEILTVSRGVLRQIQGCMECPSNWTTLQHDDVINSFTSILTYYEYVHACIAYVYVCEYVWV